MPLTFAGGLAIFWALHLRSKLFLPAGRRLCRQKLTASWLVAVFLVQPGVAAVLFATFNCYSVEGASGADRGPFLLQELSERCWEGRHLGLALSLGLSGLLLWVVGLPLWTGLLLREKRAQLGNAEIQATYGFLYNGYAPRSYFWEVWGLLRKELVAGVGVFLLRAGTLVQAFLLLLLLFFFLLASLHVRPYLRPLMNKLELFSLSALLVTVFAGLFFLAARDPASPAYLPGQDFSISETQKWVLFAFVLLPNLAFFLRVVYAATGASRESLRNACPRCYFLCCLCSSKRLLREEEAQAKTSRTNLAKLIEIDEVIESKLLLHSFRALALPQLLRAQPLLCGGEEIRAPAPSIQDRSLQSPGGQCRARGSGLNATQDPHAWPWLLRLPHGSAA